VAQRFADTAHTNLAEKAFEGVEGPLQETFIAWLSIMHFSCQVCKYYYWGPPLKNFAPAYFSVAGDGAGGVLGFTWTVSVEEGQNYLDTNGMGGAGQSGPTLYYILMNKGNVLSHVSTATTTVGVNYPSDLTLFTQDRDLALNFGVDKPGPNAWQFDDTQKSWVGNMKIAADAQKRSKTTSASGDFSGASGLLAFVIAMPTLAAQLKKEGRVRDAGIVTFLYNQILAQKISVTDALKVLRDNSIP
jgi:hypothetical protein